VLQNGNYGSESDAPRLTTRRSSPRPRRNADFDVIRDCDYRNVLLHAPIVRSGPGSDLSGIPDNQLRVVARLRVRF